MVNVKFNVISILFFYWGDATVNKFRKAFVTLIASNFLAALVFLAGFALSQQTFLVYDGLAFAVAGIGMIVFMTYMKRRFPELMNSDQ